MQMIRRSLLLALPALIFLSFFTNVLSLGNRMEEQTYYDVLGLDPDGCNLRDIKKAYRKLALKYHPDRVSHAEKEESTIKFREVSEAYEVLSDDSKRAEYNRAIKHGGARAGGHQQHQNHGGSHTNQHFGRHRHRDPFSQFDDLFRNDPFFSEAFKDMDDLFSQTFKNNNRNKDRHIKKGWGEWVMDSLGIQISTSTTTRNADGTSSTSTYGRAPSSNTYTSKSTSTVIENGRRITIQSMEQDGNRIEERYEGNQLISRKVNGRLQNVDSITADDL